jgi:hypothetical protein
MGKYPHPSNILCSFLSINHQDLSRCIHRIIRKLLLQEGQTCHSFDHTDTDTDDACYGYGGGWAGCECEN